MSQRIRHALDMVICSVPNTSSNFHGSPGCHDQCVEILYYYGPRPFKCRFLQCEEWLHGFPTRNSRNRHESSHDTPLRCHVAACQFAIVGFLSKKMREKHLQDCHPSDPLQPVFNTQHLTQDEVEPLLFDLVREDRVEAVKGVLSAFPSILSTGKVRHKLRLLASFAASSAMLELTEEPTEHQPAIKDSLKRTSDVVDYISESIKGRNRSTMEYFLNTKRLFEYSTFSRYRGHYKDLEILCQLVSGDWPEGLEIWCKWYRHQSFTNPQVTTISNQRSQTFGRHFFGSKYLIKAAETQLAGDQQLVYIWNSSGVLSHVNNLVLWASMTLRDVAASSCSITLAKYLLETGADINFRRNKQKCTPLQHAARKTTIKGAEMMHFLLLNGADPEADQEEYRPHPGKKIRDEKGAREIYRFLNKTWDELVEETKHIRNDKEVNKALV